MENKNEKQMKVGKEIVDLFRKNEIKPFDMLEILDNLKFIIEMSMLEIFLKHKDK